MNESYQYEISYLGEKVITEFLLMIKHYFHWRQNIIFTLI